MTYVIGVDIGTYESKGVLVDRSGQVLASTAVAHRLEIPRPGWAEHDAEQTWWADLVKISRALLDEADRQHGISAAQVEAIGISSIAPAVVPVDHQGTALRKAILYGVDTRTNQEIADLNAAIGEDAIFDVSCQSLSSQSAGPKILWIRNNEPDIYARTAAFMSGAGYLVHRLTGERVMDHYTAASFAPMYDLKQTKWAEERVRMITHLEKLPKLIWSHDIAGVVTEEAAVATGLHPGTKVLAGTADALAESISIGAVESGDLMLMYGSSTFYILVTDNLIPSKLLWSNLHGVEQLKTITGGTSTAGSLTRWFADEWLHSSWVNEAGENKISVSEAYSKLTELASHSPPGSNGLITLPYFSGERTPIHHPGAKGVFFGLTLRHSTGDMYRSIVEGIAYSIRHNVEEIQSLGQQINRIISVGGGTKNPVWLQSVSDCTGLRQMIPRITIGAAYGNAFLCALALGWYADIRQVAEWVEHDYTVEPIQAHKSIYDHGYRLYRRLYEQTKDIMNEL